MISFHLCCVLKKWVRMVTILRGFFYFQAILPDGLNLLTLKNIFLKDNIFYEL